MASTEKEIQACRFVVRGRVQGVGFRWYVEREAHMLEIAGWVRNNSDGSVEVQLLVDQGGGWNVVLDAVDTGASGGAPITADGYGGIRTDFMDVDFESYSITKR